MRKDTKYLSGKVTSNQNKVLTEPAAAGFLGCLPKAVPVKTIQKNFSEPTQNQGITKKIPEKSKNLIQLPDNQDSYPFNTTAQLGQNKKQVKSEIYFSTLPKKEKKGSDLTPLQKRARAKTFTEALATKLKNLNTPLKKSYKQTLECASVLYYKEKHSSTGLESSKLIGKYCNQRWCIVCSRIRTSKLIRGYMPQIEKFQNPHFITLTVVNISLSALPAELKRMTKNITSIFNHFRKYLGIKIPYLRKLEITYNIEADTYHPHYHIIIDAPFTIGEQIRTLWFKKNPGVLMAYQQNKRADINSCLELFKYFTKIVSKSGSGEGRKITGVHTRSLDAIFTTIKGKRTFQPGGGVKMVKEEIDDLQAIEINLNKRDTIYQWLKNDWIDVNTGELLTNFKPSDQLINLMANIQN